DGAVRVHARRAAAARARTRRRSRRGPAARAARRVLSARSARRGGDRRAISPLGRSSATLRRTTTVADKRPKTMKMKALGGRRWLRWTLWIALGGLALGGVLAVTLFLVLAADPELPRIDAVADYRP